MVIFPWQVWQKEGRLYCDADYKKKFVPRCADCSGFILGVRQRQGFEIELCRIQMKTVDFLKIFPRHGNYDGDGQVGHRSVSEPWGKLGTPNTFPVL